MIKSTHHVAIIRLPGSLKSISESTQNEITSENNPNLCIIRQYHIHPKCIPILFSYTQKLLIEVGTKLMFKIRNANQNTTANNKRFFQDTPKYKRK